MTDDLASWLLAQIAEDERVAREAIDDDCGAEEGLANQYDALTQPPSGIGSAQGGFGEALARLMVTFAVPARVLAECESKRRIVDYREAAQHNLSVTGDVIFEAALSAYDATLRALALPYADREGYREEWRP